MEAVRNLSPRVIWNHFAEILSIPHESKHEDKLRAYILDFAKQKGIESRVDKVGNVLLSVAATAGREEEPILVLQSHIDMVCVKSPESTHNFEEDPIPVVIDGDLLKGDGTTLGADNGIGVAIMLAILDDENLSHPPLELLFTIDEEAGMTGAHNLQSDFLKGRRLLNLDTEEWGEFYISCAGGGDIEMTLPINRTDLSQDQQLYSLKIQGLKGGHSGIDINTGRASAIKVLARLLWNLNRKMEIDLVKLAGGSKRNVIASTAEAIFTIDAVTPEEVNNFMTPIIRTIHDELGNSDPGLEVIIEKIEASTAMRKMVHLSTEKVLDLMMALPHGVQAMSPAICDLVETSCNLGVLKADDHAVSMTILTRSAVTSKVQLVNDSIEALVKIAGGTVNRPQGYPGWKPNPDSEILAEASEIFEKAFNQKPVVKAIHAGLECGIISEIYPGIDMLSIGPDIRGAHTVGEYVSISSVEKFWDFMKKILARG